MKSSRSCLIIWKKYRTLFKGFIPDRNTPTTTFIWRRKTSDWLAIRKDMVEDFHPFKAIFELQKPLMGYIDTEGKTYLLPPRKLNTYLMKRNSTKEDPLLKKILDNLFSFKAKFALAKRGVQASQIPGAKEFFQIMEGKLYQKEKFDIKTELIIPETPVELIRKEEDKVKAIYERCLEGCGLDNMRKQVVYDTIANEVHNTTSGVIFTEKWKRHLSLNRDKYPSLRPPD